MSDIKDQAYVLTRHGMSLEFLAREVLGEKHFHSAGYTDISYWKSVYVKIFEILNTSALNSIGSIDRKHSSDIEKCLQTAIDHLKKARRKDDVHCSIIISLFRLVFLLLGRRMYHERGTIRKFNTFRTLTYCQTKEQLSWLLQGHIQKNASALGYSDSFEADYAYHQWTKDRKLKHSSRENYVDWVKETHPKTFEKFL